METAAMRCVRCRQTRVKTTGGAYRYNESGLSDVTLVDVELRSCPDCGERSVVIPRMEGLHRVIARTIAVSQTRLTPERIKFLRKWLGYSSEDFALVMGVTPETVSRWERRAADFPMAPTAERLLRLMVANQEPVTRYPIDLFKTQPRAKPKPLKFRGPAWQEAVG
jgi:putative zinc finger/helix-turn-helix YgiT family protein